MKRNNPINVPQAREAMDKFKMQAAQEVGVNLQNGYNMAEEQQVSIPPKG